MVWFRYANIRAIWRCRTTRGYETKYHAVGVSIRDEYKKKPIEDIDAWAIRLGNFVVAKMCENSCQSLSTSIFCEKESMEVEIVYTSEVLVAEKEEKEIEEKVEEVEREKVEEVEREIPKYIFGQIEYLEERYREAESVDEKMAIRDEINILKSRYGIR